TRGAAAVLFAARGAVLHEGEPLAVGPAAGQRHAVALAVARVAHGPGAGVRLARRAAELTGLEHVPARLAVVALLPHPVVAAGVPADDLVARVTLDRAHLRETRTGAVGQLRAATGRVSEEAGAVDVRGAAGV